MATKGTKDVAGLFLGPTDVKADVNDFNIKMSMSLSDFHPVGQVFPAPLDGGGRNGVMTLNGFYNGLDTADTVIAAQASSNIVAAALIDGGDPFLAAAPTGYRFYGFKSAILDSSDISMSPDEAHKTVSGITAAGNIDFGFVVHNPSTLRSGTTGTPTDAAYADMGAASSASGVRIYLAVPAITLGSATNLIPTVRHSTDHSSWGVLSGGSFTAVTAPSAECKTVAGVCNRYLSISWAWTGSTGTSFYAFVGVAPI